MQPQEVALRAGEGGKELPGTVLVADTLKEFTVELEALALPLPLQRREELLLRDALVPVAVGFNEEFFGKRAEAVMRSFRMV